MEQAFLMNTVEVDGGWSPPRRMGGGLTFSFVSYALGAGRDALIWYDGSFIVKLSWDGTGVLHACIWDRGGGDGTLTMYLLLLMRRRDRAREKETDIRFLSYSHSHSMAKENSAFMTNTNSERVRAEICSSAIMHGWMGGWVGLFCRLHHVHRAKGMQWTISWAESSLLLPNFGERGLVTCLVAFLFFFSFFL